MQRLKRRHRLDPGINGWIVTTATRNYWRVAHWYEVEDLIQDGFLCYCICNRQYGQVVEQAHFMSLFKRTFINHIHDLADTRKRTPEKTLTLIEGSDKEVDTELQRLAPAVQEEATFALLMKQLPAEFKLMIDRLLSAEPPPLLSYVSGQRETTSQYLARLAGVNPEVRNIEKELRSYLNP